MVPGVCPISPATREVGTWYPGCTGHVPGIAYQLVQSSIPAKASQPLAMANEVPVIDLSSFLKCHEALKTDRLGEGQKGSRLGIPSVWWLACSFLCLFIAAPFMEAHRLQPFVFLVAWQLETSKKTVVAACFMDADR